MKIKNGSEFVRLHDSGKVPFLDALEYLYDKKNKDNGMWIIDSARQIRVHFLALISWFLPYGVSSGVLYIRIEELSVRTVVHLGLFWSVTFALALFHLWKYFSHCRDVRKFLNEVNELDESMRAIREHWYHNSLDTPLKEMAELPDEVDMIQIHFREVLESLAIQASTLLSRQSPENGRTGAEEWDYRLCERLFKERSQRFVNASRECGFQLPDFSYFLDTMKKTMGKDLQAH